MAEAALIHEKVQSQFGPVAEQYTASIGHSDPEALARVVALAEPTATDRVLDVATGAGHLALALAPHVAEVVAYDLTAAMLDETMRNAGGRGLRNVTPVQGAAEDMPFEDGRFDLVTVRIAAHHFADIQAAVRETARVVRPGGRVIVIDTTVPEDDELDRAINEIESLRDPSHVRNYRPSEWRAMLAAAGLTVAFEERDEYTEDRRMDFATWTGRMRTPPEAVAELEVRFRSATPALCRALDLAVEAGRIGFRLPLVTLLAIKKRGGASDTH
jgi:ubiquinone/menaquinone biosynthesis C-methylase UbiE